MGRWTAPLLFSPLSNASSPIWTADELPWSADVQTKLRTTVFRYAERWLFTVCLINVLSQIIIPNSILPEKVDFVCCPSLLSGFLLPKLSRVTPNADGFSMCCDHTARNSIKAQAHFIFKHYGWGRHSVINFLRGLSRLCKIRLSICARVVYKMLHFRRQLFVTKSGQFW